MAVVKAKKKLEKVTKAKNDEKALSEIREMAKARYKLAMEIYNHQDPLTQEVLDRIRDRLVIAATGVVQVNGKPYKLEQEYVHFNLMFIATEILSDLLLNGIQVANFKFHPAYCTFCKKKILGVREPKRSGR